MPLLVQKFGGTSVADASKISRAASRAIAARRQGNGVIVVVSARGHTTDELIEMALEVNPSPPAREMDMLLSTGEQISVALMAMAIEAQGIPAVSFTGAQVGIVTDSFHTKARIKNIDTKRMSEALRQGKIVIVAGFQGVDENYNITTLGRGGSDTTAVALAAVLGADACEIYTDVDGVFTTDPRIVPQARKIDRISFDEMLELASLGAGVMHSRSIEFAKKYGVPIHVRNSGSAEAGTWIVGDIDARRLGASVSGAALAKDEARITICGVPDRPGTVHALFRPIAEANIVVDMIVQNISSKGRTDVSFTVATGELRQTLEIAQRAARDIGAGEVIQDANVAKLSIVGLGMRTHPGVAATMFEALARVGVNLQMITTSEIKISVLIERSQAQLALQAIHQEFQLDREIHDLPANFAPSSEQALRPREVAVTDLSAAASMEDLVISDVELDQSQARITVYDVPDRPGFASRLFRRISDDQINVDMIVQNAAIGGSTHISFTVQSQQADDAVRSVRRELGDIPRIEVERAIAKLSALGLGMRSHSSVAVRMFRALADRNINIALINTSEVRINVTANHDRGEEGLACLRQVFDLPANGSPK